MGRIKRNYIRFRPPYMKEPITKCDICGANLYCRPRWLVRVGIETKRAFTEIKRLHLCRECLESLKDALLARQSRKLAIRYRRMRTLGRHCQNVS